MSQRPFRFLHAADLHLDQPVTGLTEAPEHLLDLLIDCPVRAAVRVFDAAIDQRVDFLLLSGGIIDPRSCAPREWLLLVEQFERLAERNIAVYWAGGPEDLVEAWPQHISWPANVKVFSRGRVQRVQHEIGGVAVCEIAGRSHDGSDVGQPQDYAPARNSDLFTLAVAHADWNCDRLEDIGVDYWALGALHNRATPWDSPHGTAHYPGTPQGRNTDETGPHGCTLVSVDDQARIRLMALTCDVLRWYAPQLALDASAEAKELERLLWQRTDQLVEESAGSPSLIQWSVSCQGALLTALRRGSLAQDLTTGLRTQYGHRPVPAWTIGLEPQLPAQFPAAWSSEESLRGDYLRAFQLMEEPSVSSVAAGASATAAAGSDHPSTPFPALISSDDLPPTMAKKIDWSQIALDPGEARRRVLREAAWLGADLLGPQEASAPEANR